MATVPGTGVRFSMSMVGDAYDIAMAESFFATLEYEHIARRSWRTKTEARLVVFAWIKSWCKPHRRYSAWGYLSVRTYPQTIGRLSSNAVNVQEAIMSKAKSWEVTDDFWSRAQALIPVRQRPSDKTNVRRAGGGRKPKDARLVFEAIVYVLRTGCQSKALSARI